MALREGNSGRGGLGIGATGRFDAGFGCRDPETCVLAPAKAGLGSLAWQFLPGAMAKPACSCGRPRSVIVASIALFQALLRRCSATAGRPAELLPPQRHAMCTKHAGATSCDRKPGISIENRTDPAYPACRAVGRYRRRLQRANDPEVLASRRQSSSRYLHLFGFTAHPGVLGENRRRYGQRLDSRGAGEHLGGESKVVFDGWGICTTWAQGAAVQIRDSRGYTWVLASSWMVLSMGSI